MRTLRPTESWAFAAGRRPAILSGLGIRETTTLDRRTLFLTLRGELRRGRVYAGRRPHGHRLFGAGRGQPDSRARFQDDDGKLRLRRGSRNLGERVFGIGRGLEPGWRSCMAI